MHFWVGSFCCILDDDSSKPAFPRGVIAVSDIITLSWRYVISPYEIRDLFGESFRIESIKETVYQGTLDPFPRALFVVMVNQ